MRGSGGPSGRGFFYPPWGLHLRGQGPDKSSPGLSQGGLEHQQRDGLRLTGQAQQVDVEGEVRCWG